MLTTSSLSGAYFAIMLYQKLFIQPKSIGVSIRIASLWSG